MLALLLCHPKKSRSLCSPHLKSKEKEKSRKQKSDSRKQRRKIRDKKRCFKKRLLTATLSLLFSPPNQFLLVAIEIGQDRVIQLIRLHQRETRPIFLNTFYQLFARDSFHTRCISEGPCLPGFFMGADLGEFSGVCLMAERVLGPRLKCLECSQWPGTTVARVSHSVHLLLGVFWLLIVANWQNAAQYKSPVSRVFVHSGHLPAGAGCVRLSKLFAPPMCCVTIFVPPCYLPIPSNTHCLQTSPVYIQLSHIQRPIQYAIEDSTLHLNSMHCHSVPISLWGFNTLKHTCHFVITPHLETYHIYFLPGSFTVKLNRTKLKCDSCAYFQPNLFYLRQSGKVSLMGTPSPPDTPQ